MRRETARTEWNVVALLERVLDEVAPFLIGHKAASTIDYRWIFSR